MQFACRTVADRLTASRIAAASIDPERAGQASGSSVVLLMVTNPGRRTSPVPSPPSMTAVRSPIMTGHRLAHYLMDAAIEVPPSLLDS